MNNKKGDSSTYIVVGKWSYYFIVLFIISIAFIFFYGKGLSYLSSKASVSEHLKGDLLYARIVNVCFAYEEDGRVFQNVLSSKKLNEYVLKGCLDNKNALVTISSDTNKFTKYILKSGPSEPLKSYIGYTLVKDGENMYPAKITVIV